jgi:hypothetical protein
VEQTKLPAAAVDTAESKQLSPSTQIESMLRP